MAKASAATRSIDAQLDALRHLRASGLPAETEADKAAAAAALRPFLQQANNLVVAKAAELARELDLRVLVDDLAAVFQRFLESPAKKDPQCWAKNALSKALHSLGCDDTRLFLAGLRLLQYEPTWGGQSEVAGTLRANCAHALIDCPQLSHQALLTHLLEVVADADKSVRVEAMRAIAQAGGDSAILLLRQRALTAAPDEDPAVLGQCHAGLLALEGVSAIPFVAKFLARHDDASAEAAVALGETRTPEAYAALLQCLYPPKPEADAEETSAVRPSRRLLAQKMDEQREAFLEPWFATVLLSAIALTRQPEAIETLLALVEKESTHAEAAIEALATARYSEETQQRLGAIVHRIDNSRITRAFEKNFPA